MDFDVGSAGFIGSRAMIMLLWPDELICIYVRFRFTDHVGCISKRFTISQCRSCWLNPVYFGNSRSSSSSSGPLSNTSGFDGIPR